MTESGPMTIEQHLGGPVKTGHHLAKALHPSPHVIREAMGEVDGFNAKFAVLITRLVGTMWCAYLFGVIALLGLGPALKPGGEGIIAWIAQTFLQLVLLSVIMVGQNVQSLASDARAANTFKDAETILDRLDVHTQGGLKEILDRLDEISPPAAGANAPGTVKPEPGSPK
ncbi:MAG: hypothetical protein ABSB69_14925 [Solirubrobacteraceae bacterium]